MSLPIVIVLILALIFAVLSTLMTIVAVATDHWEKEEYDINALKDLSLDGASGVTAVSSYDNDNFFIVCYKMNYTCNQEDPEHNKKNQECQNVYMRNSHGGIWKMCDTVTDSFKTQKIYTDAINDINRYPVEGANHMTYLNYSCFDYMLEYSERENSFAQDNGIWLIEMQNSASSCVIVSLLCLFTAVITGIYGIANRQVTACMVTGVMYVLAGVFICFGLIIMQTKVAVTNSKFYTLDHNGICLNSQLVKARTVSTGWSIPLAWVSFCFLLLASAFWLILTRSLRMEKSKSIL